MIMRGKGRAVGIVGDYLRLHGCKMSLSRLLAVIRRSAAGFMRPVSSNGQAKGVSKMPGL